MHRLRTYRLLAILVFLSAAARAVSQNESGGPHPAHAHNDYLHERPLLDALDHQFRSIEADVFARGDSLYVAHNQRDIRPGKTLALRLRPRQPLRVMVCWLFRPRMATGTTCTCPMVEKRCWRESIGPSDPKRIRRNHGNHRSHLTLSKPRQSHPRQHRLNLENSIATSFFRQWKDEPLPNTNFDFPIA